MKIATIDKWDIRFLNLAKTISSWSKDPSTKVGAVIVTSKGSIVSTGYNGFPKGVIDSPERYSNRDIKLEMIIHAEVNAILYSRQDLTGTTLYTYPLMPCSRCASIIIQTGISSVVSCRNDNPRWKDSFDLTIQLFKEANVKLDFIN